MEQANAQGMSVALLQCKMVYPLPEADMRAFLSSVEQVVVAELNHGGQFNQIVRSKFLVPTIALTKCEGLPFYAEEILEKLKTVSGGEKATAGAVLAKA
jgi:pyruvate/2-oxoacid:ferredoxin oxidoreductase alpha subunit